MIVYTADDEQFLLDTLDEAILAAVPDAEIYSFTRASKLLAELRSGAPKPDVAFLDIEMPGMTGLELAQHIKAVAPKANIIFVTGFSQYAQEAYAIRPSGYVMKPATKEKIIAEIENLRNPPARTVPEKRVRIQCFGDFQVFVDGTPVAFKRAKSKELLAYLVDRRGASCNSIKLAAVLWEDDLYDRARQKQFSVIRADLLKSLRQAGADILAYDTRDSLAVVPDKFDCDYYMALAGDTVSINTFVGEYMAEYSWAEFTAAALNSKFDME